ncbi:hypothetical protein EP837_02212 [Sphingobium sp. EP60837]|jgi:hypothetical protein|nr:hypothetical protein EP837_02212 [Sphingobium sp. EP60837]
MAARRERFKNKETKLAPFHGLKETGGLLEPDGECWKLIAMWRIVSP